MKKLFIAYFIITFLTINGCACIKNLYIDRGTIPNTNNPIRPPDLTNEWDNVINPTNNISTNQVNIRK